MNPAAPPASPLPPRGGPSGPGQAAAPMAGPPRPPAAPAGSRVAGGGDRLAEAIRLLSRAFASEGLAPPTLTLATQGEGEALVRKMMAEIGPVLRWSDVCRPVAAPDGAAWLEAQVHGMAVRWPDQASPDRQATEAGRSRTPVEEPVQDLWQAELPRQPAVPGRWVAR